MKTRFDETVTALSRVQQQNNDWMDTIKQTGATPEQLGASLSYLDDINKGTPESLERAYVTMQGEMNALAKVLGKEAPGYDPLDDYPELKARVKEGDIEHDDAVEIAGGRTRAAFSKKVESQPAPAFSLDDGYDELATLGNSLRASDNRYDEKLPFLKAIIEAAVSSGADPATWARTVKTAYEKMPKLAEKVVPKPPVTPNPIRPGGPGGSGTLDKEAGTAMEAMNQSLERGY